MSEQQARANDEIGTKFYGASVDQLNFSTPKSTLLDESLGNDVFTHIGRATSLYSERANPELQQNPQSTGWWAMPGFGTQKRRLVVHHTKLEVRGGDPVESATSDRITLLARKYVDKGSLSNEEKARLAIVTERVRRLLPAVTAEEVDLLEVLKKQIKEISVADGKIRAAIGMK